MIQIQIASSKQCMHVYLQISMTLCNVRVLYYQYVMLLSLFLSIEEVLEFFYHSVILLLPGGMDTGSKRICWQEQDNSNSQQKKKRTKMRL